MKKLGLSLILIFSFGLQSAWSWDHNYRHFESTHLHTNNNCYGYALARLNGKTEGEAYCAPERSYAMAISTNNLSTDFENLNIGDVLVWGYVQVKGTEAESGHAAYVISIPTPFVLNNVLVRQVPNNGGSPENKLVSQNTSYGDVLGYIHNPNGYSLRVTLANLFGNSEDANSRIEKYIYTSGSKGPGVYIPVLHGNDEYCSINNPEMMDIQAKETHDYSGKTYTFLNWKRNGMIISTNREVIGQLLNESAVFEAQFTESPLDINISGPTVLDRYETGVYTANASGGTENYIHYKWWRRNDDDIIIPFGASGIEMSGGDDVGINALPPGDIWVHQSNWDDSSTIRQASAADFSLKCEVTDLDGYTDTDDYNIIISNPFGKKGVDIINSLPSKYAMSNNYPNPFNPSTTIRYSLVDAGHVKIEIYNINGRLIQTLTNTNQEAGVYSVEFIPENLSTGVYYYKIQVNNFTDIKRMVYLK